MKYIEMINNRYISILLNMSKNQILKGIDEINNKYRKTLIFNDKLICLILDKWTIYLRVRSFVLKPKELP